MIHKETPMNRLALLSCVGALALAGAAHAQPSTSADAQASASGATAPMSGDVTQGAGPGTAIPEEVGPSMGTAPSDPASHPAAPQVRAPSADTMGSNVSASVVQPRVLTNGPVPDTRENRQKYGQPMSGAGRRSAAAGD